MECYGSWHSLLPVTLDLLHQALHFTLGSDGDAHESLTHIFAAFAQQNALVLEFSEQFRPVRTEVRQKKVSGAGVRAPAKPLQLVLEPRAQSNHVTHVAPHC